MSRKVRLSETAQRDVEQAYLYIRLDSPDRARRWREKLLAEVRSLKSFPERHAVLFDAVTAGREVRQMSFGIYLVFYSIDDDMVNVLTVRHGARRPINPDELPKN